MVLFNQKARIRFKIRKCLYKKRLNEAAPASNGALWHSAIALQIVPFPSCRAVDTSSTSTLSFFFVPFQLFGFQFVSTMFPEWQGVVSVLISYSLCLALHLLLPSRVVTGYCCGRDGKPLKYRLNGLLVYAVMVGLFFLSPLDVQRSFHDYCYSGLFTANLIGLAVSLFFFLRGVDEPGGREKYTRCMTVDNLTNKSPNNGLTPSTATARESWASQFFLGMEWNPRFYLFSLSSLFSSSSTPTSNIGLDVKMFLYVVGAVHLQLNIFSCLVVQQQQHHQQQPITSTAMLVYVFCFGWFLVEYLLGEEVHLYTYDLFAEKIGFKLCWGCLVFYPFFYCIGAYPLATSASNSDDGDISRAAAISCLVLFFLGWGITRGANMQKFYFRTQPQRDTFLFGLVKQRALPGTRILVSGWYYLPLNTHTYTHIQITFTHSHLQNQLYFITTTSSCDTNSLTPSSLPIQTHHPHPLLPLQ